MEELLTWLEYIEDVRQKHLLKDILVIVLFATLANADDWVEIAMFAEAGIFAKIHQTVIQEAQNYQKTRERAHGQIEIREYYQTDDIKWLSGKTSWKGIKSIGMERKTIWKGDEKEKNIGILSAV